MTMGQRIKEERIKHGYTLDQLGEILGVQKAAIHKYEAGLVENIPRSTISKMAKVFGVSPSYLMGFEEEDQMNAYMEELRTNPGMRILFDAAKGASTEDLEKAARIIQALKGEN